MNITKKELEQLKLLREFQLKPPTSWTIIRPRWKFQLFYIATSILASLFFFWGGWPLVGALFLGFVLSDFISYVCFIRARASSWQLSNQIMNWERIEELIAEAERK